MLNLAAGARNCSPPPQKKVRLQALGNLRDKFAESRVAGIKARNLKQRTMLAPDARETSFPRLRAAYLSSGHFGVVLGHDQRPLRQAAGGVAGKISRSWQRSSHPNPAVVSQCNQRYSAAEHRNTGQSTRWRREPAASAPACRSRALRRARRSRMGRACARSRSTKPRRPESPTSASSPIPRGR